MLEKIKAVFIGEMLTANNAQRKRPVNLSGELAQTGISLKSVEKSDYEAFHSLKNYILAFKHNVVDSNRKPVPVA
ncbi:MAG: hypothetical protein ACLUIN_02550 [[Ruminococcus] lactaris]|uniref:hypothetical protein n=1 Tax=[Ruminococcus] lactaris TaxID=46228 RepID=UPI0039931C37